MEEGLLARRRIYLISCHAVDFFGFLMEKEDHMPRGLVARAVLSIVTLAAFLVGSLIFVGFYTSGYDLLQKVVVVLVAMIIAIAALAILWVTYAGRWAGRRGMMGRWRD
jgi:hypothetical protein